MNLPVSDGGGTAASGPFAHWKDSAGPIRADGEGLTQKYGELNKVYTGTNNVHKRLHGQVFGEIAATLPTATFDIARSRSDIDACVFVASGCAVDYADRIDEFNSTKQGGDCRNVDTLNAEYAAIASNTYDSQVPKPTADAQTGKVSTADQQAYDTKLEGVRNAEREKLKQEYGRLVRWMEDNTKRIKGLLDKGPDNATIMALWKQGALPSYSYLVFPDINFQGAKPAQTPVDLRVLDPSELEMLKLVIPTLSLKDTLSGQAKFVIPSVKGKVSSEIRIMPDGSVKVIVHGELGAGVDTLRYGEYGAGGLLEYELRFPNIDQAKSFLDGIDDATFASKDLEDNFNKYMEQYKPVSKRVGGYVNGQWRFGDITGDGLSANVDVRMDAYKDEILGDTTLKGNASVEASLGDYKGKLDVGATYVQDQSGAMKSLTLTAALDVSGAKSAFGTPPGITDKVGMGGRAEGTFTITPETPHYQEIADAYNSGDMAKALQLAKDNGQLEVAFSQTTTQTSGKEVGDADFVGAKYEIENKNTTALAHAVKPAGQDYWVEVPPVPQTMSP